MIKDIIWDAGGTLFDTYPAMISALAHALVDMKCPLPEEEIAQLLRVSRQYAYQELAKRYSLDIDSLRRRYSTHYAVIGAESQPVFRGVLDVCTYITRRGGSNFIVTHRSRQSLQRLLDAYGLTDNFKDTITSDDGFPRKPEPESTRAMIERHQLNPDVVLAVGDRQLDIEAGQRAGIRTCHFGHTPITVEADLAVTHYADLLAWLKSAATLVTTEGVC